jgi:cytochrome c-type biogenesis protein
MALATLGVLRIPFLNRERRVDLARIRRGPGAAFPFGMAFALGWVPCLGPVLTTITTTAAATSTAAWGGVLMALYAVGLGLPFIALAVAFDRARGSLDWLRRHSHRIEQAGGVMMLGLGLLFVSGKWETFFTPMQRWFAQLGWPPV